MLISRTRYITVTVPLSIQEYRWFFFTFITISIYNTASPDIVLVRKLTYLSDLFDDENAKLCLQYSLRMIAASQRRKL